MLVTGRTIMVMIMLMILASACTNERPFSKPVSSDSTITRNGFTQLELALEGLAMKARIPGFSAAIVGNDKILWSHGFGYVDLENSVVATPNTPYRLASVSKPIAAVIIMQLVEQGRLSLDTAVASFRAPSRYREAPILVRHLLSHTSEGIPGDAFQYSGDAYVDLTLVIEQVTGKSYPTVLKEYIFSKTGMACSAPGQLAPGYDHVISEMAKPYEVVGGEILPSAYFLLTPNWNADGDQDWVIHGLKKCTDVTRHQVLQEAYTPLYAGMASGGLISTAVDLSKFDIALNNNVLLLDESKQCMFTPTISNDGTVLPYGLGWFIQNHHGLTIVWHHGECASISSLYIKVPEKQLSFILLASTGELSMPYPLSDGDILVSPFARAFLDQFLSMPKRERGTNQGLQKTKGVTL